MYQARLFLTNDTLVDNDEEQIAPLGELSNQTITYATDIKKYPTLEDGWSINVFLSKNNGVDVVIPDDYLTLVRNIFHETFRFLNMNDILLTNDTLIAHLSTIYAENTYIITAGEVINIPSVVMLPKWINIKSVDTGDEIRVWLNNELFSEEYDHYTLRIIPPIDVLDDLFQKPTTVIRQLEAYQNDVQLNYQRISDVIGNTPPTNIISKNYVYEPSNEEGVIYETTWVFLVNGRLPDEQFLNTATKEYINEHTERTPIDWGYYVYPRLYEGNDYIIIPIKPETMYNHEIASRGIANIDEIIEYVKSLIFNISTDSLIRNLGVFSITYNQSLLVTIASPDNEQYGNKLAVKYSTYIPVSPLSRAYNDMTVETQVWSKFINDLVIEANQIKDEAFYISSNVYMKNDHYYLSKSHDGIVYHVLIK